MSALFSWPTVTAGMRLPFAGGRPALAVNGCRARVICGVVLPQRRARGGHVAPVVITGRCSGLQSGPTPVLARHAHWDWCRLSLRRVDQWAAKPSYMVEEGRAGDAAVLDGYAGGAGVGQELRCVYVPRQPAGFVGVD